MSNLSEARKRANQKFNDSVKNISIKIKKDSDLMTQIEDSTIKYKTTQTAFLRSCLLYCLENDIDISAYL